MACIRELPLWRDIEMENVFTGAERFVQLDRRVVAVVSLNINDPRTSLAGDLAELFDQARRYTPAAVRLIDRQVVNIDLDALLLKLLQHIRNKPAHHLVVSNGDERNEILSSQKGLEIIIRRDRRLIRIVVFKGSGE